MISWYSGKVEKLSLFSIVRVAKVACSAAHVGGISTIVTSSQYSAPEYLPDATLDPESKRSSTLIASLPNTPIPSTLDNAELDSARRHSDTPSSCSRSRSRSESENSGDDQSILSDFLDLYTTEPEVKPQSIV